MEASNMSDEAALPEPGRVNRVRNEWLVFEDEALAHNLQSEEFENKYRFNRSERKTARKDVPLAKYVQSEEEARLQRERLQMLERQKAIAEKDAELAEKFQKLEEEKMKHAQKSAETDDMAIAAQLQQEELLNERQRRLEIEMRDQEYARQLFEKEYRKYENYLRKRELARARKQLEAEQQQEVEKILAGCSPDTDVNQRMKTLNVSDGSDKQPSRFVRPDGRVEDLGDFSDFYVQPDENMAEHEKKQLQELQDEELARLLQDQERKRGAQIDKSALKNLEQRDARLAQIIQEQEKMKSHRRHRQINQHHSLEATRTETTETRETTEHYSRQTSATNVLPPPIPQKSSPVPQYEHENSFNEQVNESPCAEPIHNHTPLYKVPGQSPYSHRPLPETPSQSSTDRITVVPVTSDDVSPPGSPPPPGYRPPPDYPNRRRPTVPHDTSRDPRTNKRSPISQNVIAAIDPTFREDGDCLAAESTIRQGPRNLTLNRRTGAEDGYCDLDELGPVQGQRRAAMQGEDRGSAKRNSCKQQ